MGPISSLQAEHGAQSMPDRLAAGPWRRFSEWHGRHYKLLLCLILLASSAAAAGLPKVVLYGGPAGNGLPPFILYSVAGALAALTALYGRAELTLLIAAVVSVSALWSLGLMGWLGIPLDLGDMTFPLFISGICAAFSVLAAGALLDVYRGHGASARLSAGLAAVAALAAVPAAGALAAARLPPLRSPGLAAVIAIACGLVSALTVLPLGMRVLLWGNGRQGTPSLRTLVCGVSAFIMFGGALVYCRAALMPWLRFRYPGEPAVRRKKIQGYLRACCRLLFRALPYGKILTLNAPGEAFSKPAVIVCNHQSVIDILGALTLPADIRMVVKPWVWNSFFIGPAIREAGYILSDGGNTGEVFAGAGNCLREGDFLLVFPEGTRSDTGQISRFRRGAFEMAARARADILPVLMCETRSCMPKSGFWVGDHRTVISVMPRLSTEGQEPGGLARRTRALMEEEYEKALAVACDGPEFFRRIRGRYNYLGPCTEQYVAWKLRLDPLCRGIAGLVPRGGVILDLGQGCGLMANILAAQSARRSIIGVDYDPGKVAAARRSAIAPERMVSELRNILDWEFPQADTVLLIDVLHYWPPESQGEILRKAHECMRPGGRLVMRESCQDGSLEGKAVKAAEIFATVIGHNKSRHGVIMDTRETYLRRLREAGFGGVRTKDDLGWKSNLVFVCGKTAP